MSFNWINPNDYSFNALLLMERFQIRLMMNSCGWFCENEEWKRNMGIALNANPAVKWYLSHRCPECTLLIEEVAENAPMVTNAEQIRNAEVFILLNIEDFTIYTTPEVMAERCAYIRGWNKERLFELVDLKGKTVLDVGAGSGRLTFAAAEKAEWVYASEPVGTLREFIREKSKKESINNIRVLDGFITELPFPDNTFDIVISGHVINDNEIEIDMEVAELERVCKSGGWLIDCLGDSEYNNTVPQEAKVKRGFEAMYYKGSFGYDTYCYRKQVWK